MLRDTHTHACKYKIHTHAPGAEIPFPQFRSISSSFYSEITVDVDCYATTVHLQTTTLNLKISN
jgi:hypothetical protein